MMKFYYGLSSPAKKPEVMTLLQQFSAVGGEKPQAAAQVIIDRLTGPFAGSEVDTDSFYQCLVVFAVAMAIREQSSEPCFDLSDENGTTIEFSKEGQWHDYMRQTKAIPDDRVAEAHEILLAYGVVRPMMDLSGLAAVEIESAGGFCL
ncbi:hypothetical protein ACRCPS_18195 [Pseudomonas aeruginosa]